MYSKLPLPYVIEEWKRREKEKQIPSQSPLQLPIPPQEPLEPPKRDDTGNGADDRGIVIIDLTACSLDTLL